MSGPAEPVRDLDPRIYAGLVRFADATDQPMRCLVRVADGEFELVREESLSLSVSARVRFRHAQLLRGTASEDAFLRDFPAEALAPAREHLATSEGLRAVARGIPCSTGCGTGVLRQSGEVGGDGPFVVAVDRVEAQHTGLLRDPRCAGLIAVRGSPADHFALLARESAFCYLAVPDGVVDTRGLWVGGALVTFGTTVTVDVTGGSLYTGAGQISPAEDDEARAMARSLLARRKAPVSLTVSVDGPDVLGSGLPGGVAGIGILRMEHLIRLTGLDAALRRTLESDRHASAFAAALAQPLVRVLQVAHGLPVAVRLLDLPVQELPGLPADAIDPTLGLRGIRQGVRWPHAYRAQIHALVRAAHLVRESGGLVSPLRILVPMVCTASELRLVRTWAETESEDVRVGAMLETPAALAEIEVIAAECDFALFGTNDLTALCLGIGRADYLSVLDDHLHRDLLAADPFDRLHHTVLRLVREAAARARHVRPGIELGLCGRHARDSAVQDLALEGSIDHLCVEIGDVDAVTLETLQRAWQ